MNYMRTCYFEVVSKLVFFTTNWTVSTSLLIDHYSEYTCIGIVVLNTHVVYFI